VWRGSKHPLNLCELVEQAAPVVGAMPMEGSHAEVLLVETNKHIQGHGGLEHEPANQASPAVWCPIALRGRHGTELVSERCC
jgi:hypothetical protein